MAFRKLTTKSNHQGFTKSAGCSQKASPMRLDSGITLQQTIEKLESLDFMLQSKNSAGKNPQAIQNQLTLLEKNLDSLEIANIGVTLSSQQLFKMYSNFIENLSTTISLKDSKLSNMILRGLKGCKKAFNCLYTEIQTVSNEKHLKSFEVNKKSSYAQTHFENFTQEKPCTTPEFENLKQLPKAFQNIHLSRISDQLSELFDSLNTINTELPAITVIEHLSQPNRYRPFKSEEVKQVMISELREIRENIENFIQKKRMKTLRIHKEIQTDKEPKNATWVALEIMNEEKELNLLRLRGKYEVVNAEKNKLEKALIKTSSLCSDYEKKFAQLESENIDLTMKAQSFTEKSKGLERRVLELGAVIKKVITFKGFQKNIASLNENNLKNVRKYEKTTVDQGPYVRRPSAYKNFEENIDFMGLKNSNKQRRKSLYLDDHDSGDSLKSFRDKVNFESEKVGADGETSPVRRSIVRWPEGNNEGFIKNSEGKYVRGEIVKNDTLSITEKKEVNENLESSLKIEDNFHDMDLDEFIKNTLQGIGDSENEVISEKQLNRLIGKNTENTSIESNPLSNKSLESKKNPEIKKTQEKHKKKLISSNPPKKTQENRPSLIRNRKNSKQSNQNLSSDSSSSGSIPNSETPFENSPATKSFNTKRHQPPTNHKNPKNPKITIKSSNPSPIAVPSHPNPKSKNSVTLIPPIDPRNLSQSYNTSLISLLSKNPSGNIENNFSDKDSFYEEFPNIHLQIPSRKSVQIPRPNSKNRRALSRSSVYSSNSKQLLDFSFTDNSEGHSDLLSFQEDLKNLETELKNSFSPQQNEIFQEIQKKEEELKIKQALFSSKYVQCNLWSPQEFMDGFDRIRCKEKYRLLLQAVFENDNDINLLGPKGRRELANSVKGHSLTKCSGTCEHLKRALNIVQKYKGKLYPLKLIKM